MASLVCATGVRQEWTHIASDKQSTPVTHLASSTCAEHSRVASAVLIAYLQSISVRSKTCAVHLQGSKPLVRSD